MRATDTRTGAPLPGFPAPMMGLSFLTAPAVADVTGNGQPDVINGEDSNNVAAFDQSGQPAPGWPKFTGGWSLWTPAVGDLNSDGHNEVAAVTREGYLFVWNTPGRATQNQAYSFHQDNWHTGRFGVETRPPLIPRQLTASGAGQVCWTAPGDAWAEGTAARYELRTFDEPPTPESFSRGQALGSAPAPAPSGSRQCASVPAGTRWVGLRAIGHSGLIGLPAGLRLTAIGLAPSGDSGLVGSPVGRRLTGRCVSRRRFTLHVLHFAGATLTRVTLYVRGRRVAVVHGSALRVRHPALTVDLRGLPRGPVRVRMVERVRRNGRSTTRTIRRSYRTCTPKDRRGQRSVRRRNRRK